MSIKITNYDSYNSYIKTENVGNVINYTFQYPCTSSSDCHPFEITFSPGLYFLECWGASGATHFEQGKVASGGYGGYSSGVYLSSRTKTLYLYLGGTENRSEDDPVLSKGSYNCNQGQGQNTNDGAGGGATDFRTKNGEWYENPESRIIVAGGGGSGRLYFGNIYKGGDGGGLEGEPGQGEVCTSPYGTQTESRMQDGCSVTYSLGSFGQAASADHWSSGGGGYYGGGWVSIGAGGGGSGYVSDKLIDIGNYHLNTTRSNHVGRGKARITIISSQKKTRKFNYVCATNYINGVEKKILRYF